MNGIGADDVEHELIYAPDAMRIAAEIATHDEAYAPRYVLPGALAATYTSARRAARSDPMTALRHE